MFFVLRARELFSTLRFRIVLWITLIVMGTFMRGPNWNFFGLFELWDTHKVEALNNVDLSEFFWLKWLGSSMPKAPAESGFWEKVGYIIVRESPGILSVLVYFVALPPILAVTVFRSFFVKMGLVRYMLMSNLLLLMAALPLKMILRWSFNLKYIIAIPEYFLNF